jgi:hypothetical protein
MKITQAMTKKIQQSGKYNAWFDPEVPDYIREVE